jgi:hypothetical protein
MHSSAPQQWPSWPQRPPLPRQQLRGPSSVIPLLEQVIGVEAKHPCAWAQSVVTEQAPPRGTLPPAATCAWPTWWLGISATEATRAPRKRLRVEAWAKRRAKWSNEVASMVSNPFVRFPEPSTRTQRSSRTPGIHRATNRPAWPTLTLLAGCSGVGGELGLEAAVRRGPTMTSKAHSVQPAKCG